MLFDKFYNQTVIQGHLIALDPIHIGASANNSLDPTDVDNSVLKDNTGRPVIPGSSIKGVLRSYYESIIRSVFGEEAACDVMDNKKCCTELKKDEIHKKGLTLEQLANAAYEYSCKACRLFGGREFAGKLKFKDCYAVTDVITEFRDGVGIDRDTGSAKQGAKFDYEIIPKGTRFDFLMIADNLDDEQMKHMKFLIDKLQSGEIAIGGKTTRGLGRVKLEMLSEPKTKTVDDLREELENIKKNTGETREESCSEH